MDREIRGGQVHAYPVELQAGQFLRVFVQEDGVDLTLRLLDPQGKTATGTDSRARGRAESLEDLAALAGATGSYRLEAVAGAGRAGRYSLRVEGPRAPGEEDRKRAEAVKAMWQSLFEPGGSTAAQQIRSLETALALWQSLHEDGKSAEALFSLGRKKACGPAALSDFERAAELWGRQPGRASKLLQASVLTNLGRCLQEMGRREEARKTHEQALAVGSDLGEYNIQAENLNNLASIETENGEIREGIELQRKARELARQAGNQYYEGIILNNLAGAYDQLAEPQEALKLYEQALKLARSSSDQKGEVKYLNNIGDMYGTLGNWEEAFERFQEAAELSRSLGDAVVRGKVLINLAVAYRRHLGQMEQARTLLEQALALGRESPELRTFALVNLAALELESEQSAAAVKYAREAVALGESLEREALSRYTLGRALGETGDLAAAQAELGKALALAHKRGDGSMEAQIELALARVEKDRGDLASALARIDNAIHRIESRRNRVVSPELRTSFLASKQDYYELKIDVLMTLHAARGTEGFAADALEVSEWARARGLLEILNEAGDDIRLGADPALLDQERKAREELNARDWHRRILLASERQGPENLAEAERRLEEARDTYEKCQVELREGSPRYAALTLPQPLDIAEIRGQVLDGEALLLEYALGSKRSFLWAVGPDSLASFELPGRERIEKVARRYYELLTVRNSRGPGEPAQAWKKRVVAGEAEAEKVGRELSELILKPVEKLLGSRPGPLLIVADGALQYIPFAVLPIPSTGAPLATRHVIVSLPSASVLAVMRRELNDRPPASRALAVFADPVFQPDDDRLSPGLDKAGRLRLSQKTSSQRGDGIDPFTLRRLKNSRTEAETIAALLPPDQVFKRLDFAASRDAVVNSQLNHFRNVHFATHGVLESHHPELSKLVLSLYNQKGNRQDGFLRLNDIYNLRLGADLVVLSACQTALGKEIRGEGLVGLTRGFMHAGASRVLASLWSVDDQATAELMGNFYRGMLRDKLSPAEALRKAQLEMAKKPRYKSPHFWAGFSLQGEWR